MVLEPFHDNQARASPLKFHISFLEMDVGIALARAELCLRLQYYVILCYKEINYIALKKSCSMFTIYTPQDANKVLPEVKRKFHSILSQKKRVVLIQDELQNIIESGSGFESFIKKKQELNREVTNLYKSIELLEDMGIVIKSVDEGLIDFPSLRFNEEVWLCWKTGETEIKFWHGKEEGFNGRKPLAPRGFLGVDDLADLR